jgi:hypothetical protein
LVLPGVADVVVRLADGLGGVRGCSGGDAVVEGVRSSAGTVRRCAVLDSKDDDESSVFVDFVDEPVGTASGRSQSGEFTLQLAAETVWIADERAEHEFDDRSGGALGESIELSFCWPGDAEFVGGFFVAHFFA